MNAEQSRLEESRTNRAPYCAVRKHGYTIVRTAPFVGKALALAQEGTQGLGPPPGPLPRGAGRRPSSGSPPDCAVLVGVWRLLGTAQYAVSNWLCSVAFLAAALVCLAGAASAQEKSVESDAAQANNPLANFTALNLHNYYIGKLTDTDKNANQFWLRYAQPFSIGGTNWLLRASLPISTFPLPPSLDHETGLGDANVFAAYLIDVGNPKIAFGVGPQLTMPTATTGALGSEKWSAGVVNTLFSFTSPQFQYGYLLSWQGSFTGHSDRRDVNVGSFQPFLFYQLGGGTYLRSSAVMMYDFDNSTYTVPIGLGIGQVIPREKVTFNVFVEPQMSVADKGAGWAKWQIFLGLNMQFK